MNRGRTSACVCVYARKKKETLLDIDWYKVLKNLLCAQVLFHNENPSHLFWFFSYSMRSFHRWSLPSTSFSMVIITLGPVGRRTGVWRYPPCTAHAPRAGQVPQWARRFPPQSGGPVDGYQVIFTSDLQIVFCVPCKWVKETGRWCGPFPSHYLGHPLGEGLQGIQTPELTKKI